MERHKAVLAEEKAELKAQFTRHTETFNLYALLSYRKGVPDGQGQQSIHIEATSFACAV